MIRVSRVELRTLPQWVHRHDKIQCVSHTETDHEQPHSTYVFSILMPMKCIFPLNTQKINRIVHTLGRHRPRRSIQFSNNFDLPTKTTDNCKNKLMSDTFEYIGIHILWYHVDGAYQPIMSNTMYMR